MSQFLDVLQVSPTLDGEQWALIDYFRYVSDLAGDITVPLNFVTDYASIPRIVWNILPPWGRYGSAAIVHDWLYWTKPCDKATADSVLREAMLLLGVDKFVVDQIYIAVHLFGQAAWDHNTALKQAGYTRMVGKRSVPPYAALPDLGVMQQ